MHALVTGGGGFLGHYIVEQLLSRGDSVTVFARSDYLELSKMGAKTIRGNICDFQALHDASKGIDTLFHVAAMEGLWGKWDSFFQTNVIGTKNVIDVCLKLKIRKLIFTSSPSVVFNNQPQEGCNEIIPYPENYESHYAHTKAIAEQMIVQANGENLLTLALRPHLMWGPGDTHILPQLVIRAKAGQLIQVGDGDNLVDLTYVEDAARAHLQAADALEKGSALPGSIYFISQDEPVLLWPWVNNFLYRLGLPPINKKISLPIARVLGTALEFIYQFPLIKGEPRITRFLASELAMSHYYDISKAKRDFGYRPMSTMEQVLEKTIPYFTQNLRHS